MSNTKKRKRDKLNLFLTAFLLSIFAIFVGIGFFIKPDTEAQELLASKNTISHVKNKKGTISIVEFADIQCPACSRYHSFLKSYLKDKKNVSFEFKHFPLNNIHKNAELVGKYAVAISTASFNDRKFWDFLDITYKEQSKWAKLSHKELHVYMKNIIKKDLKLDYDKIFNKLESEKILSKLMSDKLEAKKLRLRGTPTFIVNGSIIQTPRLTKEAWDKVLNLK